MYLQSISKRCEPSLIRHLSNVKNPSYLNIFKSPFIFCTFLPLLFGKPLKSVSLLFVHDVAMVRFSNLQFYAWFPIATVTCPSISIFSNLDISLF